MRVYWVQGLDRMVGEVLVMYLLIGCFSFLCKGVRFDLHCTKFFNVMLSALKLYNILIIVLYSQYFSLLIIY